MKLTTTGYSLKFIQTHPKCDLHEKSYVYKFFSSVTKFHYIVYADYHRYNFIAIKFYCKKDRKSSRKYSNIINKGDVSNILVTCAKCISELLKIHPQASFGFIGSRTIDHYSNKIEGIKSNQRFKLYKYHIPQLIGNQTFLHKSYPNISAYLLINRKNSDLNELELLIQDMIKNTYPDLLNVNI